MASAFSAYCWNVMRFTEMVLMMHVDFNAFTPQFSRIFQPPNAACGGFEMQETFWVKIAFRKWFKCLPYF